MYLMLSYFHMIKKSCAFFTCLGSSLSLGSQDASSLRLLAKLLLQSLASAFTLRLCLPLLFLFPVILVSVSLPFHFYFCLKGGERFFHFHLPQPLSKRIKASPFARSPFAPYLPSLSFYPFALLEIRGEKKKKKGFVLSGAISLHKEILFKWVTSKVEWPSSINPTPNIRISSVTTFRF